MEQIAAMRAEWLARLAEAIDSAQRLAWQLRTSESASNDARELYSRLEAARFEIDSIRGLAAGPCGSTDPEWLKTLGWSSSLLDPPD